MNTPSPSTLRLARLAPRSDRRRGPLRSSALADYAAALKAALHRHHVLFLRDQTVDCAGQSG